MPAVDLTFARSVVADLATDTCQILRDDGTSDDTWNPVTMQWTKTTPTVVFTGNCWVRDTGTNLAAEGQQGEASATKQRWAVKVPDMTVPARVGDVVVIIASVDPAIVGRRFVVRDIGGGTYRVARRLNCEAWVQGTGNDWAAP